VQRLLDQYDPLLKDKIQRYYEKALLPPTERSMGSVASTISEMTSHISTESYEVINRMTKEHKKEITKMNERMVDMSIAGQVEQQKRKQMEEEKEQLASDKKFLLNKQQKEKEAYLLEKGEFFKGQRSYGKSDVTVQKISKFGIVSRCQLSYDKSSKRLYTWNG